MPRNNKQIKRLAKYLFNISWEVCFNWTSPEYEWVSSPEIRNHYYDKAVLLMKKMANNEFTGEDNHGD